MKLEIKNVKKKFIKDQKEINVLDGVSSCFEAGKFYAITGKSGAGKSTLLKCMGMLLKVDDGKIIFDGVDVDNLSDDELAKIRNKEIGIVFQEYNLFEFLTAFENIAVPMIISGEASFNDMKNKKRVDLLLEFVGLEKRGKHNPRELSGGEQQRVSIARALINEPSIILADEPTGSIDDENKKIVLNLLKNISKDKCVVVVTHDKSVLEYADVIYVLEDGKLREYEV